MRRIFTGKSVSTDMSLLEQFMRYAVVGGIASVADVSLFYLSTGVLKVNHLLANTLSFTAGLLVNYFLSREWVFKYTQHSFARDFTLFAVIGAMGLGLSNLILYMLIDQGALNGLLRFMGNDIVKLTAKLIAVFVVLFWNFIARKAIVFRTS